MRLEAEAVEHFFQLLAAGQIEWIASAAVEAEVSDNPNAGKKFLALQRLSLCTIKIPLDESILKRGDHLELAGYGPFDALHLALAESANADRLLTTDDRFLRRAKRGMGNPRVQIQNPVNWRKEILP